MGVGVTLAAPIAFVCGGAGGALSTMAMIEIGYRHEGPAPVDAAAVLVPSTTGRDAVARARHAAH